MGTRRFYKPTQVESILQEAREAAMFIGQTELVAMKNIVETAKRNGRIGDKIQVTLDPKYIHIPTWQRNLDISISNKIGLSYNKNLWDSPKVIYNNGILECIDGMHRIFGAYLRSINPAIDKDDSVKKNGVVVEILEIGKDEAIEIFLNQTKVRNRMSPEDYLNASLEAKKPEYVAFHNICTKHNVQIKGYLAIDNPVGIFTPLKDGTSICKANPQTFDNILNILIKLKWNNINSKSGNAFCAKYIRIFKKLYAYYADNIPEMEKILLQYCKGTKFFEEEAEDMTQNALFDYLSDLIIANLATKKLFKTA